VCVCVFVEVVVVVVLILTQRAGKLMCLCLCVFGVVNSGTINFYTGCRKINVCVSVCLWRCE
jgi:hypothetical protein